MSPAQLRASRQRLGMTHQALASVLSTPGHCIDERLVRRWEAGTRPIPDAMARWIVQAARVPEPTADWFRPATASVRSGDAPR